MTIYQLQLYIQERYRPWLVKNQIDVIERTKTAILFGGPLDEDNGTFYYEFTPLKGNRIRLSRLEWSERMKNLPPVARWAVTYPSIDATMLTHFGQTPSKTKSLAIKNYRRVKV